MQIGCKMNNLEAWKVIAVIMDHPVFLQVCEKEVM